MNHMKAIAACVLVMSICGGAWAHELKSLYTTIDLASCRTLSEPTGHPARLCPGLDGWPVWVSVVDLRTFVSVGRGAERHSAARQSLGAYNSIFAGRTPRATLEWRYDLRDGKKVPYATILRYRTRTEVAKGEVVVVSRVAPGESCHVAHIDAVANPDAIAFARRIADSTARTFDCKSQPIIAGKVGHSPM